MTAWKQLGTPDIQQGCSMLQSRLWINASTWLLWRVLSSLVSSLETKYQIIALTHTTSDLNCNSGVKVMPLNIAFIQSYRHCQR